MILLWTALGVVGYAYAGYPLLLLLARRRRYRPASPAPARWPSISISLPVHNGAGTLRDALEAVLAAPYPGPRQCLVISDGSTDATVRIAEEYAARGVELFALTTRVGKTEAEGLALPHLRGEIVVNTDASVQVDRNALMALIAEFADPSVGVASSVDVSLSDAASIGVQRGETAYVGYEMWVRQLESAVGGIVGASGCLYAIRRHLHARPLPSHLSRDFSAALYAREQGYRAVSVARALCYVPKGRPRRAEYLRKVRTMARGLATLWHHRRLLDPFRYGGFAWRLLSHKLLRWLTPFLLAGVAIGLLLLPGVGGAAVRGIVLGGMLLAIAGWWWPFGSPPRLAALAAYAASAVVAGMHAWWVAFGEGAAAMWEPTTRDLTTRGGGPASPAG